MSGYDFPREPIDAIFQKATEEERWALFEHEAYELFAASGSESSPHFHFLEAGKPVPSNVIDSFYGDRIVLKIVSPTIVHKTEVGGIRILPRDLELVRWGFESMLKEVPINFAAWLESHEEQAPDEYRNRKGEDLRQAVAADVRGVLLCQFMEPDSTAFGHELFIGLRQSRDFGLVLTAGIGGVDTELYVNTFKRGMAAITAAARLVDADRFFELFKETLAYKILAGLTRGSHRVVQDKQIKECFAAFLRLAELYSPLNPDAPYVLQELEVNPFGFSRGLMAPLDGLCKFAPPRPAPKGRPQEKVGNLLAPESIGLIGVSSKRTNMGRVILRNVLDSGFDAGRVYIVSPDGGEIDGVKCVPSVSDLPEKVDLFVLAVGADAAPGVVKELIDTDNANSVILIPGGLGEKKGSEDLASRLKGEIERARQKPGGGPVFLGANSMGVLSRPGGFDTMFIPPSKLPKRRDDSGGNIAFISQSGAYMISRMSKLEFFDPAYAISCGNQIDLTVADFVRELAGKPQVDVLAIYVEGFNELDGVAIAKAARKAVRAGQDVIFYKAGRTPAGKLATSGHTASIAGRYDVCVAAMYEAGAAVAETFTEFEELVKVASLMHDKKVWGNRVAAISNAGYESVGMADNSLGEEYHLELEPFQPETREKMSKILEASGLSQLVDVKNPLDITPMASDAAYVDVIAAILEDPEIDCLVAAEVPLTPQLKTLPEENGTKEPVFPEDSIVHTLPGVVAKQEKPVVAVVDSGKLFDPLANALQSAGVPTFRSADRAIWILGMYIQRRQNAERIRSRVLA